MKTLIYTIAIILSVTLTAHAVTLLVDTPTGEQKAIEVSKSGGYFDKSRVVWDTRSDGPLPDTMPPIGGLEKCQVPNPEWQEWQDYAIENDGYYPDGNTVNVLPTTILGLCVNNEKKAIHDAVIQAKADKQAEDNAIDADIQTRREQAEALLADWDNVTNAELKQIIRYFLKKELRK